MVVAVVPLIKALKHNLEYVELAVVETLGEIGDTKASEPLRFLPEKEGAHDMLWMAGLVSLLKNQTKRIG